MRSCDRGVDSAVHWLARGIKRRVVWGNERSKRQQDTFRLVEVRVTIRPVFPLEFQGSCNHRLNLGWILSRIICSRIALGLPLTFFDGLVLAPDLNPFVKN